MNTQLISGWSKPKLGELVTIKYGKGLPTKNLTEDGFWVFGANGIIGRYSSYLYEDEQVLISCRGAYSGKINWSPKKCYVTNNSLVLEINDETALDKKYLFYALQNADKSKIVTGSAQPQVTINSAVEIPVPLAPLEQQKRIVAEIEKQFSRLDEAVANLKRVKANLKRYRAAVLKAALEGHLVETEAELARREGRSYETGAQLLQRVLETRRSQWQGKGKYKEPAAPDITDLPELPEGWVWACVNQIAEKVVDGTHHTPEYVTEGIAFISVKDVRGGTIHFGDTKFISPSEHLELIKRCNPEVGDVVITKSGTIGRTALIITDRPFSLFVSVALIKPVKPVVISKFLRIALDGYIQSIDIAQDVKGGLLKNLHLEDLRLVTIPIPPESEQHRLVAEVERHLSRADEAVAQVTTNLKRSEVLRQSVLRRGFYTGT